MYIVKDSRFSQEIMNAFFHSESLYALAMCVIIVCTMASKLSNRKQYPNMDSSLKELQEFKKYGQSFKYLQYSAITTITHNAP